MPEDKKPKEVPIEILQQAIVDVAKGVKTLLESRLREDTIAMLIQQSIKPATHRPTLDQIREVLRNAARLDQIYLKPTVPEKK